MPRWFTGWVGSRVSSKVGHRFSARVRVKAGVEGGCAPTLPEVGAKVPVWVGAKVDAKVGEKVGDRLSGRMGGCQDGSQGGCKGGCRGGCQLGFQGGCQVGDCYGGCQGGSRGGCQVARLCSKVGANVAARVRGLKGVSQRGCQDGCAPTLAKTGARLGSKPGHRLGARMGGCQGACQGGSWGGCQGGHQGGCAPTLARVGHGVVVGVGVKEPRWVASSQVACQGGCRGGCQGSKVGAKEPRWVSGWVPRWEPGWVPRWKPGWVGIPWVSSWVPDGCFLSSFSRRDSFRALEVVSCPVALSSTWEPNFGPRVPFFFVSHPTFGLWPFRVSEHIFVLVDPSWVLERICGPWVPFCIPKLVFWCLIPILGAHLAPSAHPGQTERLGAPGQDRACTRGAPNMHQGALGPHVSAGRCARGGVWAPRCRRDTARTRRPVQVHARRPGRVHTRRPSKVRAPGQGSHLANGAHFAREGVHLDGGGWPGWIRTWVANSAVKRAWAGVVLGWVTSREVPVLHPFLVFRRASQCYLNKPFARLRSRRGRAGPGCAARTTARAGGDTERASAHPRRPEHTGHGATRALCAHPGAPEVLRAHPGEIGVHLGQCALGRVAHVGQGAR
ncbi:hypothetical protein SUGI_1407870 [Cryptomeria japonica]|uniref:Uncharacterized protein n=1 Tax=Cryptomeria japonica TaxID=3369 RepID=A0AAD3NSJ5_CRYJA|nr:hypothetical protein SUGI_1407870 [Cryptomeria japonica]